MKNEKKREMIDLVSRVKRWKANEFFSLFFGN
jgi:hypothetical protein